MNKIILNLFLAGLLFGSGPCLASCGPILISYIAATKKNIFKGLLTYILFSLARISVYLLLALLIFFLGKFTLERLSGDYSKYIFIIGGSFIVLVGLLTALGKSLEIKPLKFLHKNILEHDKKSILIIGLVIGLIPCAPLLGIIAYVGLVSKSWAQSLIYGFSFGLGTFMSPLILLAILAGIIPQWLQDKQYYYIFRFICGIIIIFLGLELIIKIFK